MPFTSIPPAADRSVTAVSFKSSSSARNSAFWVSFAPGSRNRVTQRANRAAIVSTVGMGPVNLGADPTSGNAGERLCCVRRADRSPRELERSGERRHRGRRQPKGREPVAGREEVAEWLVAGESAAVQHESPLERFGGERQIVRD